MAFPTTAVIDAFTRVDAATLGASYSMFYGGPDTHSISSNRALTPLSGTWTGDYYNVSTFGPACEIYFKIVAGAASPHYPCARIVDPGTGTPDGYCVDINSSANTHYIQRIDNGVTTSLGASISQAIANGDSVGLECSGSSISFYYKSGAGAWSNLASRTDATYAAAGYLAWCDLNQNNTYDDFGGGTIAAATVIPVFMHHYMHN